MKRKERAKGRVIDFPIFREGVGGFWETETSMFIFYLPTFLLSYFLTKLLG